MAQPLSVPHGDPLRVVAPSRYFYKSVKWVRELRFVAHDVLGYWERAGGYHNNADFWREERYVSGNLEPASSGASRALRPIFIRIAARCSCRSTCMQAIFAGQSWLSVQLKNCNLSGCNLQGADLRDANLTNSDLQGVNLRGADLSGADLEGVLLMGADLRHCSMRRARLAAAEFWRPGTYRQHVSQGLVLHGAAVDDLLEDQQLFYASRVFCRRHRKQLRN